MLNHRKWSRLLSAYIDEELSSEKRKLVETHLKRCKRCRKELTDYKFLANIGEKIEIKSHRNESYWTEFPFKVSKQIPDDMKPKRSLFIFPNIEEIRIILVPATVCLVAIICCFSLKSMLESYEVIPIHYQEGAISPRDTINGMLKLPPEFFIPSIIKKGYGRSGKIQWEISGDIVSREVIKSPYLSYPDCFLYKRISRKFSVFVKVSPQGRITPPLLVLISTGYVVWDRMISEWLYHKWQWEKCEKYTEGTITISFECKD